MEDEIRSTWRARSAWWRARTWCENSRPGEGLSDPLLPPARAMTDPCCAWPTLFACFVCDSALVPGGGGWRLAGVFAGKPGDSMVRFEKAGCCQRGPPSGLGFDGLGANSQGVGGVLVVQVSGMKGRSGTKTARNRPRRCSTAQAKTSPDTPRPRQRCGEAEQPFGRLILFSPGAIMGSPWSLVGLGERHHADQVPALPESD